MFYSEDVEIIRELIHNKSIDLYDLHLKYRLSPAQVSRSVKNLLNEGVVEIEGETISMTDLGREWIIKNRHALFLDENRKYWKIEKEGSRFVGDDIHNFEYTLEILRLLEEDEE